MITVNNLGVQYGGTVLFQHVDLQFTGGNCYGVIGANGAGKSTFLKILSGELESTSGEVFVKPGARISVLRQDQFQYDAYTALDTVMMGNQQLYDVRKEKDTLYEKEDFSEADGLRAAELEAEFADMNGWEAESDASRLLQSLGVPVADHETRMANLDGRVKVKVLLARALFGDPDIVMLDEPTNNLDALSADALEELLLDFPGLVIVVSHDRHFLNTVCTHIVDIDYGKVKLYVGNYDFWYESSQLVQQLMRNQNKRNADKIKELQEFVSRFSANRSKSRQATARRRMLDKLSLEEIPASTRRYPFVGFTQDREVGKDILFVTDVCYAQDGEPLLQNVSFTVNRGDKIALVGENELAQTTLLRVLMEELTPQSGAVKWGGTVSQSYFPKDNTEFFADCGLNLLDWMRQYSEDQSEIYLRGFLGRMLFSGEDVFKPVNVLSGGEKVRCMLSRMMLNHGNFLLLDQPTNHLDLEAIQAVNRGLCAFPGNLLLASHDHEMLQSVCNRILVFQPDGTVLDRKCSYDEYLESVKDRA